MRMDTPVVIVGAGLAGLVTAWELTRAGIACRVLEASSRPGGRVETTVFDDGLIAEAHMEEFWEGSPAYPLLREFGLDVVEDGAHSSMVLGEQLLPYQGEGDRDTYLSGMFNPRERSAWLRWNEHACDLLTHLRTRSPDLLAGPWAAALIAGRFSTYVRDQVREPRVAEWIRVVVESETGIEWDRISALDGVTELQPFLDSPAGFGETSAHVSGGNQRLIDALVQQLPEGTVRTNEPVSLVRHDGRQVSVRHGRGPHLTVSRCDHVVIAVPLWSLDAIQIDAQLEPAAARAITSSTAGSYVKVLHRLRPEAARLWERHGDRLFALLSDSQAGCIYLGDGGEGTDLVLTQLIHAQHARQLCALPNKEIARRAVRALDSLNEPSPLWPGVSAFVTETRAYAYPRAVAYWSVDRGRSRYDETAASLRRPQGRLHFSSDTLVSSHSDGAVRSGQRVARTLVALLTGTAGRSMAGSR